ncbi:MAG: HEAT repeat domain-containing protein [Candidatus Marinimicrobia bacterium]|nr:HEAT repeat domain-containing protein [Candidatus Neomarinimicrobiota bacterium]
MKLNSTVKAIQKVYPEIKQDLRNIVSFAIENPECREFYFGDKIKLSAPNPQKMSEFESRIESLLSILKTLLPQKFKVSVHDSTAHGEEKLANGSNNGYPAFVHIVIDANTESEYCFSHFGYIWHNRNWLGRVSREGEIQFGRFTYVWGFMTYEEIEAERKRKTLGHNKDLFVYLKSSKATDVNFALNMLFRSEHELTIPLILEITKEAETFRPIILEQGYQLSDLEAKVLQIAEDKPKFSKDARSKIIPHCNSTNFEVQYLALKIMRGKWTRSDKEQLSKIRTRGNFGIELLKLEAMTVTKVPGTTEVAIKYMKHKNELLRNSAVESLGKIGKQKELDFLNQLALDSSRRDKFDPGRIIKAIYEIKQRLG